MNRGARAEGRVFVRLSATLAARLVHDAEAAGERIRVTAPRTLRALERGFHQLLSGRRRIHLLHVSEEVAAGLREHGHEPLEKDQIYVLALAFDRFGRGSFLLRAVSLEARDSPAMALQRARGHMEGELEQYLRSIQSPPENEPTEPT